MYSDKATELFKLPGFWDAAGVSHLSREDEVATSLMLPCLFAACSGKLSLAYLALRLHKLYHHGNLVPQTSEKGSTCC